MIEALAGLPLEFSPGTAFNYSVATDVLGHIVEIAGGMTLSAFFHRRLLGPLGMRDTDFFVPDGKRGRFAACYLSRENRLTTWDDGLKTAHYAGPPKLESGGGGLAGTAADYLRFARMLLNRGELDGVRYLSPKSVQLMTQNHLPGKAEIADLMASSDMFSETGYRGVGFGLGVAVMQDLAHAALPGSIGEYGWGGLAGTFLLRRSGRRHDHGLHDASDRQPGAADAVAPACAGPGLFGDGREFCVTLPTSAMGGLDPPILEERPAQRGKSVQWTDLSDERREPKRAATPSSGTKLDGRLRAGHGENIYSATSRVTGALFFR